MGKGKEKAISELVVYQMFICAVSFPSHDTSVRHIFHLYFKDNQAEGQTLIY